MVTRQVISQKNPIIIALLVKIIDKSPQSSSNNWYLRKGIHRVMDIYYDTARIVQLTTDVTL